MRSHHILIAGAGMGGLAAALGCARAGLRVTLAEQAETLGEVGAGLTLSSNATHGVNWLGLSRLLLEKANVPAEGGVRHWSSGRVMVSTARGDKQLLKYGANYLQIHRADFHAGLSEALSLYPNATMLTGHKLIGFDQTESQVTARFANGRAITADAMIAADGIRSGVRQTMLQTTPPRFTGQVAWRGLVPLKKLGRDAVQPDSAVSIGPGRIFNRYLIRNSRIVNYVALVQKTGWEEESWTIRSTVAELAAEFEGWHETIRAIIAATDPDQCFKWALFDRDPLPRWHEGRVALLGDAAHPMLPFLGQGAAMAIEDGVVLARAMAKYRDIPEALARYEAARKPRATEVMLNSRQQGMSYQRADTETYSPADHGATHNDKLFGYNPVTAPI
jgi:salicylate hydroxylase